MQKPAISAFTAETNKPAGKLNRRVVIKGKSLHLVCDVWTTLSYVPSEFFCNIFVSITVEEFVLFSNLNQKQKKKIVSPFLIIFIPLCVHLCHPSANRYRIVNYKSKKGLFVLLLLAYNSCITENDKLT